VKTSSESQNDVRDDMINITNYEKLDKFISSRFGAVVLDESSILKSFNVKYSTTGSLKPNKLF
jgi:hypothetical protein